QCRGGDMPRPFGALLLLFVALALDTDFDLLLLGAIAADIGVTADVNVDIEIHAGMLRFHPSFDLALDLVRAGALREIEHVLVTVQAEGYVDPAIETGAIRAEPSGIVHLRLGQARYSLADGSGELCHCRIV